MTKFRPSKQRVAPARSPVDDDTDSSGGSAPLRRAVLVLEAVATQQKSMSLPDIVAFTGLPTPTAHRIARNLVSEGLLEASPNRGGYTFGARLLRLLYMSLGSEKVQEIAEPIIANLANSFQATAFVTQILGGEVRLVSARMPERSRRIVVHPGTDFPIHATASGKVLFAYQAEPVVTAALKKRREKFRPKTLTDPLEIRRELAKVREDGFAVSDDEFDAGVFAVAAPVHLRGDVVMFSVGLVGLREPLLEEFSRKQIVQETVRTAAALAASLGSVAPASP